jgi:hypothetical protein
VLDGGGQILDRHDMALLTAMAEPLMHALDVEDDNDLPYYERLPIRNALYLAAAPTNYVHTRIVSSAHTRSLGDDGVQRLAKWKRERSRLVTARLRPAVAL